MKILARIQVVIIIIIFANQSLFAVKEIEIYKQNKTIRLGDFSYIIWESWWHWKIENGDLRAEPDAQFLFISISIRNESKEPKRIPPFFLVDNEGNRYQRTSKSYILENNISYDLLNPKMEKYGVIVFDVWRDYEYKLLIASKEKAYVKLNPQD